MNKLLLFQPYQRLDWRFKDSVFLITLH